MLSKLHPGLQSSILLQITKMSVSLLFKPAFITLSWCSSDIQNETSQLEEHSNLLTKPCGYLLMISENITILKTNFIYLKC